MFGLDEERDQKEEARLEIVEDERTLKEVMALAGVEVASQEAKSEGDDLGDLAELR